MATGFLHLHTTLVVIFLLFYGYKVFLLLRGKTEKLSFVRNKTKIVEIILGSLILITGAYLFIINPLKELWLWMKLFIVILFIPLGIVAMKRENKVLSVLTFTGFIYFFIVSNTKSLLFSRPKIKIPETENYEQVLENNYKNEGVIRRGKLVYEMACTACHGVGGDAMVGGAKNLKVSKLTFEEKLKVVKYGKGLMMAYKDQLSEKDMEAVVHYIETFTSK